MIKGSKSLNDLAVDESARFKGWDIFKHKLIHIIKRKNDFLLNFGFMLNCPF